LSCGFFYQEIHWFVFSLPLREKGLGGVMTTATFSRWIGALAFAVLSIPWATAWAATVKIGLIDFALRHDTLKAFDNVKVRSITFEMSGYKAARYQTAQNVRGHGDVMASELIATFQDAAPGHALELYVASPFLENPTTGKQSIDFEQLAFAYMWFAHQGVKIIAQTFVAKDNPKLAAAIAMAAEQGLVILASAGNGPQQNAVPPFPATYDSTIGVSTTALQAALSLEENRNAYVRYSVKAPTVSSMKLRHDPELGVLNGSSRATVAAAGLLGALATRYRLDTRDDAIMLLDSIAIPIAEYDGSGAYGMGVLVDDLVAQHLRAPTFVPKLKRLLLSERASA
jgi:hypothetical protein